MKEAFFQSTGKALHWDRFLQGIVQYNGESRLAILDKNLVFLYVVDSFHAHPGLKDQPLVGQRLYEVFPNATCAWKDMNSRVLVDGESFRYDDDIIINDDGDIERISWTCFPWYDTGGHIGGLVMCTTFIGDSGQEKAYQEKLRSAGKLKARGCPDEDIADILSLRREDVAAL
jgi:hypothetical protein